MDPTQRLLGACRGEPVDRPPVWLMRQAGRYLPEYRAVREGVPFLEMCRDVDKAVEVSLQPVRLVGTEAVIFFSDIFVPVAGMGVELDFQPGPVLAEPIRKRAQVEALLDVDPRESVPFVFQILRTLRRELESQAVPLLGFAGAPFTLACYMVEGQGSRHFSTVKRMMYREPQLFDALLDRLTTMTIAYLTAQIENGAQAVQLFDTWAGMLGPEDYRRFALPTHRRIAEVLPRDRAPLILYVQNGGHVVDEMIEAGSDVISLDWRLDLADAAKRAGSRVSIQGNLDPTALHAPPEEIERRVREIAAAGSAARGHVLNLGHGCHPDTPVEGVRAFTDAARALGGEA